MHAGLALYTDATHISTVYTMQLMSYLQQLQVEAELHSIKRVARHHKAVVHQQEVIAQVAIAQLQGLLVWNVPQGDELHVAIARCL